MVTPVAAYMIYAQTRETGIGFTYFGKGKVIDGPTIEVGQNGMKLEFTTDHNGKTAYLKENEKYKNDEYEFRKKIGNPKVVYHKDTDLSDVKFRLLQKRKPVQ
ncbi:Hypothetical predicted protein [Mytilus galloprovincialis]|nr:Hypothetical predicted protein [Mytilus galloprovincialis]